MRDWGPKLLGTPAVWRGAVKNIGRHPGLSALAEVALMFAPALPAYLWLWPNVRGTEWLMPVQAIVYFYFLAGSLIVGLRRWNLRQLGVNRQGVGLSLICGAAFLLVFALGRLATDLPLSPQPLTLRRLAGEVGFYLGLVGPIEELLFRGLIYRALEEWRGSRWAIWGSALAFGLYHIGWQGPLGALGCFLIGAVFGTIRWRAGGIVGLIVTHALLDLISVELYASLTIEQVRGMHIARPALAIVGDGLLLALVIFLWKFRQSDAQTSNEEV
jgi:membrane protease YdiL (CAAX protease family)